MSHTTWGVRTSDPLIFCIVLISWIKTGLFKSHQKPHNTAYMMTGRNLRLLTAVTVALLVLFAACYIYIHRYKHVSTPDSVILIGIIAGLVSMWTFFAGLQAWRRRRSPL